MTNLDRGDVLLGGFVFSEETGTKLRPALIISSPAFHRGRQEVVAAAITSNVRRRLFGNRPEPSSNTVPLGDLSAASVTQRVGQQHFLGFSELFLPRQTPQILTPAAAGLAIPAEGAIPQDDLRDGMVASTDD